LRGLRLSLLALQDIADIGAWIAAGNPDASEATIRRIFDALRLVRTHPEAGVPRPRLGRSVRCVIVQPYQAFYEMEGEEILVLRVLHGARKTTRRMMRS
jgi:toxin ParE1/3/4